MSKRRAAAMRSQAHHLFVAETTLRSLGENKLADGVLAVAERIRLEANEQEQS